VSGYNVLIPDSSRDLHPEMMLPIMDGLQQLQEIPVVMSMNSIRDMYEHTRYVSHGSYEIFQFYVQDLLRKNNIDFGVSVGLSAILEDGRIEELHHVMEECGIPNLLYLNARDQKVADRLESIAAAKWRYTYFVCSSEILCQLLRERGFERTLHAPLGTSPRIFHPHDGIPENAPFALKHDDERLTQGYDVSFVGSCSSERLRVLSSINDGSFRLAIFGDQAWAGTELADCYRGGSHYLEESNTIYNSSLINLDILAGTGQFSDYISNRVGDCMSANGLLLMRESDALCDLLGPRTQALFYEDAAALSRKIKAILADGAAERQAAAALGAYVRSEFSWDRCLQRVLPRLELCLLKQN
jgi:glycosyltransferase involved in cell wall biosynthesis